jgi:hypothetical protein
VRRHDINLTVYAIMPQITFVPASENQSAQTDGREALIAGSLD